MTDGCDRPVSARGRCPACYLRAWRLGEIEVRRQDHRPRGAARACEVPDRRNGEACGLPVASTNQRMCADHRTAYYDLIGGVR